MEGYPATAKEGGGQDVSMSFQETLGTQARASVGQKSSCFKHSLTSLGTVGEMASDQPGLL